MVSTRVTRVGDAETRAAWLEAAGAHINQAGAGGKTPLMLAAAWPDERAVKHLLALGADPLLTDDTGLDAMDFAATFGCPRVRIILDQSRTGPLQVGDKVEKIQEFKDCRNDLILMRSM